MNTDDIISDVDSFILGTYGRIPLTIKEGRGSWVFDNDGNKYLDYTSGIAVSNLGHSNKILTDAIKNQAEKVIHTSNLFYLEPQAKLARMLVENSFADLNSEESSFADLNSLDEVNIKYPAEL